MDEWMNEPPVAAFLQADGGKKAGKRGLFGRQGGRRYLRHMSDSDNDGLAS